MSGLISEQLRDIVAKTEFIETLFNKSQEELELWDTVGELIKSYDPKKVDPENLLALLYAKVEEIEDFES